MYQTPELLLVGAAQHLVLGASGLKIEGTYFAGCRNADDPDNLQYHDIPAW